jgi:hypothetical protein
MQLDPWEGGLSFEKAAKRGPLRSALQLFYSARLARFPNSQFTGGARAKRRPEGLA